MTPLWWMLAVALLSWIGVAMVAGEVANPEALYGMAGPLVATCGTWVAVARAYRIDPGRLTQVMAVGLGVKAVFFAVYVVLVLRVLDARPAPFVTSFTAYFIALYGMEALFLRRLFADGMSAVRGA